MIGSERTAIGWAMRTSLAEGMAETLTHRPLLERFGAVFFLGVFLALAAYSWVRPDYNWDMVAYVATALEDRYQDPVELHAQTWHEIAAGAREAQLYELQYGNPYNRHQWENPVDFQSQLSMYRVKVAYVWLLRALEPAFGLVNATLLLSILPALGFGLICLRWLGRQQALQGGLVLAPALILADLAHMMPAVTPDMLLAVVSLGALYLLWRGRDLPACLLLFASVFVRPDNIILIFALLLTALAFGWRKLPLIVTFLASFMACMAISRYGDHPGWWAHFYFSCVHIQNSMAGFQPDFSMIDFARGYVRGVVVALADNDWPAIFAILLAAWALLNKAGRMGRGRENALMFALAIGTLGKFASFPLPDDRFYFVFIAGMAVLLIAQWKPHFDPKAGGAA